LCVDAVVVVVIGSGAAVADKHGLENNILSLVVFVINIKYLSSSSSSSLLLSSSSLSMNQLISLPCFLKHIFTSE